MTPGLVSAVVLAHALPSTGAVVQEALFVDDSQRTIADLQKRLVESEQAYAALCDTVEALERQAHRLRQENHVLQQRCADLAHVAVYGTHGIVRR